jgi:hypothetical protein
MIFGGLTVGFAAERIPLNSIAIVTDQTEPSYVQYGTQDLAHYLAEITGAAVRVTPTLDRKALSLIVVGKLAEQVLPGILDRMDLGKQGYVIKSVVQAGNRLLIVAGATPEGTNYGVAALMRMIHGDGKSAYVEGPLDIQSQPSFAVRGIHLNGWAFNYPYAYRPWKEADWKRFIDLLWCQGGNLLYMLPMMEIMPVPLSPEDEAYLQEVRRVIDYAHEQRGMEVWLMTSANRVAVSNCGERVTKLRPFWVNQCQVDMNPADPQQFDKIMKSLAVLYSRVNNADGFGMIDSDPGGWPQSPISDQVKIFKGARALLDEYNWRGKDAKLIDWMWVGWGRHKFANSADTVVAQYDWTEKNPDASDVAFMQETIRAFRKDLPEPWSLIAGFSPYLGSAQREDALGKTVFLPYGAIEYEPAFPLTNLSVEPVRNALGVLDNYPGTSGLMGNNMTALLQLPRTYFFLSTAWDYGYRKKSQRDVLLELSENLYPDHRDLIADAFAALEETDPQKINAVLQPLEALVSRRQLGRPGFMGREIFPDPPQVAKDLVFQLKIRVARQRLEAGLYSRTTKAQFAKLVEEYLDVLLAWDKQTGWNRLIKIGIWRAPIYSADKRFNEGLSNLKKVIGNGAAVTSYANVSAFFDPMSRRLIQKYGEDAVMIGCIEPLKLAVIQAP